jgi:hypothetical protein
MGGYFQYPGLNCNLPAVLRGFKIGCQGAEKKIEVLFLFLILFAIARKN